MKNILSYYLSFTATAIGVLYSSLVYSTSITSGENKYKLVNTETNCAIYELDLSARTSGSQTFEIEYIWDGACVNNLAEGRGTLTKKSKGNSSVTKTVSTSFYRSGIPIGYSRVVVNVKSPYISSTTEVWRYHYGDKLVSWINSGLGLKPPQNALTSNTILPPTFDVSILKEILTASNFEYTTLTALTSKADLRLFNCGSSFANNAYPECSGKSKTIATYFAGSTDDKGASGIFPSENRRVCPKVYTFHECGEVAFHNSKSVQNEIIDFVNLTKADVESEILKSIILMSKQSNK